jgi:starch synthase (maltosyl-transferring)
MPSRDNAVRMATIDGCGPDGPRISSAPVMKNLPDVDGRRRVVVAALRPSVPGPGGARHAIKRTLGETLRVEADLLIDGHDLLAARLHVKHEQDAAWTEAPMQRASPHQQDRFYAEVVLDRLGTWHYRVEGWVDRFATFRHGLARKVEAGQDVSVELQTGARLAGLASLDVAAALGDELASAIAARPDRRLSTMSPDVPVLVERERARFSAWYELFPRSFGTLADVTRALPYVAEMGFDVLYLPPVHPIGRQHRKGPNNSLTAAPGDPGSPWAIGGPEGGHEALHPELGTLEDFAALVARARELGIDVAIDIAFQASPDHPWVKQHPEWFVHRPDGSIQYAENPPKKYQDVYPFDFECDDWRGLWDALASVFMVWAERGVRTFRVDNPHTKPIGFWQWCIARVRAHHPDAIFLSEAFTRPLLLQELAKVGFSQSYTYFTWRTTAHELRTYLEELLPLGDVVRPNFWPNTPDILPEHLQIGGRPMFAQRAILAATLTASWGIYGPAFELCEAAALPGKEEYADSEKYQRRQWNLEAPHSLRWLIARLNAVRRAHPALQQDRTLRFHDSDSDALLCYSKTSPAPDGSTILCVVSTDPYHRRAGWIQLDLDALGLDADTPFQVHDLLSDARFLWHGARNYVEIDPNAAPGHVFAIRRQTRREHGFEYFL